MRYGKDIAIWAAIIAAFLIIAIITVAPRDVTVATWSSTQTGKLR